MDELIVSSSPHFHSGLTVRSVMRDVLIALVPVLAASVYFFGVSALLISAVSVAACVGSEALFNKFLLKKKPIADPSAAVTGLLFAFTLPPGLPLWMTAIGAASGLLLGKMIFGGIGNNPFNPALVGRALLLSSWPVYMTSWKWPHDLVSMASKLPLDGVTSATPLGLLKEGGIDRVYALFNGNLTSLYFDALFVGNRAGSIGETSTLAILIGAGYLVIRKHITLHAPLAYLGTVAALALMSGHDVLFHLMSGGLVLGAFFMATDYVTCPFYGPARAIFGAGCGVLTFLIRVKGGFPEGVCYSILIMNMVTPLLNRYMRPQRYGSVRTAGIKR